MNVGLRSWELFGSLIVGVVVGWSASGVDLSREAVAQEAHSGKSVLKESPQRVGEFQKEAAEYSQLDRLLRFQPTACRITIPPMLSIRPPVRFGIMETAGPWSS